MARWSEPLSTTAAELRRVRSRLDPLRTDDEATDIRAVFHWSYRLLGADAARLFRLTGLVPGADVSDTAAASLLGLPLDRTRPLLAELVRAHLLAEPAPGRYTCHDLLRAYAVELASTVDSATDRREALHRLLDHHLHTARAAALLLNPNRPLLDPDPPRPGVVLDVLDGHDQAMGWFTAEQTGLLASLRTAADDGFDRHAARLPSLLTTFLDRRGGGTTGWPARPLPSRPPPASVTCGSRRCHTGSAGGPASGSGGTTRPPPICGPRSACSTGSATSTGSPTPGWTWRGWTPSTTTPTGGRRSGRR
jgi:hypothetical protein